MHAVLTRKPPRTEAAEQVAVKAGWPAGWWIALALPLGLAFWVGVIVLIL